MRDDPEPSIKPYEEPNDELVPETTDEEGGSWVRPITREEYRDYDRHGLGVALVYQAVSRDRITQGFEAGRHDAAYAWNEATYVLGKGPRCIYFAADKDIVGTDLNRVLEYLRGAASIIGVGRVGVYGVYSVIEAAIPSVATYGWQTTAWSGGRTSAKAHCKQLLAQPYVGGVQTDANDVYKPDWGQHNYGQAVSAPTAPKIEEVQDEMYVSVSVEKPYRSGMLLPTGKLVDITDKPVAAQSVQGHINAGKVLKLTVELALWDAWIAANK